MYKWAIKQHCLFDKNGRDKKPTHDPGCKRNRGVLFSQSDHTYCRITAGHFKYQGRQGFQGNEKIFRRIDIKQANISETDTGFRISGCGSVCIQVVPPDPKVRKLATRSTYMDGGCISNKLVTPKAYSSPPFALIGRVPAKSMRDMCTLIIITPVWPSQSWYTQLLRMFIQHPIYNIPFPHFQIF